MSDSPQEPNVNAGSLLGWSIVAALLCGPLTIVSWISSNSAMRKLDDASVHQSSQRSLVQAARIVSIIGMIVWIGGVAIRASVRSESRARYGYSNWR